MGVKNISILVECGKHQVVMEHRVSLANYYNAELIEIRQWCTKTFSDETWYVSQRYPGWLYFKKESDATLFRLVWT